MIANQKMYEMRKCDEKSSLESCLHAREKMMSDGKST